MEDINSLLKSEKITYLQEKALIDRHKAEFVLEQACGDVKLALKLCALLLLMMDRSGCPFTSLKLITDEKLAPCPSTELLERFYSYLNGVITKETIRMDACVTYQLFLTLFLTKDYSKAVNIFTNYLFFPEQQDFFLYPESDRKFYNPNDYHHSFVYFLRVLHIKTLAASEQKQQDSLFKPLLLWSPDVFTLMNIACLINVSYEEGSDYFYFKQAKEVIKKLGGRIEFVKKLNFLKDKCLIDDYRAVSLLIQTNGNEKTAMFEHILKTLARTAFGRFQTYTVLRFDEQPFYEFEEISSVLDRILKIVIKKQKKQEKLYAKPLDKLGIFLWNFDLTEPQTAKILEEKNIACHEAVFFDPKAVTIIHTMHETKVWDSEKVEQALKKADYHFDTSLDWVENKFMFPYYLEINEE